MKTKIFTVLFLFSFILNSISVEVSNKLIEVISKIESNKNPKAIGDNGKAYGILQIHEPVIQDVNRIYKTNYIHEDAFDPEKAKTICKLYLKFYGEQYEKNEGKKATNQVLARIWNGGPLGYKKEATKDYWKKIKKEISNSQK